MVRDGLVQSFMMSSNDSWSSIKKSKPQRLLFFIRLYAQETWKWILVVASMMLGINNGVLFSSAWPDAVLYARAGRGFACATPGTPEDART